MFELSILTIFLALCFGKFRCFLFGHLTPMYNERGWFSPGQEYAEIVGAYPDGIGRVHAEVFCSCPRCKKRIKLCRVHLPNIKVAKVNGYWETITEEKADADT